MLESCQRPENISIISDMIPKSIEYEKAAREIAIGQVGTVYFMKSFVTGLKVLRQVEISRKRSHMLQIDSHSRFRDNYSTIQRNIRTPAVSRKYNETKSVAIPTTTETNGDIALEIGGGIRIPLVADSRIKSIINVGGNHSLGLTVTNIVRNETTVSFPIKSVKCPPRKRIENTWTFFSYVDTVEYLMDLELDGYK